jgi:arylsulfatase A-like enzyme
VPLLVTLPGQTARVDVEEVVSLIDVAPTVLDVLGVTPPTSFRGRPLLGTAGWHPSDLWRRVRRGWKEQRDEAVSQLNVPSLLPLPPWHTAAVVRGSHKMLVATDGSRAYYDLAADHAEARSDALGPADRARLDSLLAGIPRRRDGAGKTENLDERARERLKALGYISD